MNNLLRRFGLRRGEGNVNVDRDNQSKQSFDEEFFSFRQFGTCGFPNKPSVLALDEELGVLAIGTKTGFVHIFGQPGVHLQGEHETHSPVFYIAFLKGKSEFVAVCEDSSFVVWTLKTTHDEEQLKYNESTGCPQVIPEGLSHAYDFMDSDNLLTRGKRQKLDQLKDCVISCCRLDERKIPYGASKMEKMKMSSNGSRDDLEKEKLEQTEVSEPRLYVGMTDGNVLILTMKGKIVDVSNVTETNIGNIFLSHDEVIVDHFSEDEVRLLGSVVSIILHPTALHKILVGYSAGFSVLWDILSLKSECVFSSYQQLESLAFNHDGSEFVSSHSDGSYIIWNTIDCTEPREPASTPYGPYQCEAINKFVWKTNESSSLMVFSGGMPRSGYGDRWTVTAMRGDGDDGEQSHVVLDLTSRVIDFVVVDSVDSMCDDEEEQNNSGENHRGDTQQQHQQERPNEHRRQHQVSTPHSLVVLAEEEMVVIDLVGRDWPSYRLPHLTSPHCSAITSVFHLSEVPEPFLRKLTDAGKLQQLRNVTFTRKTWPFLGGQSLFSKDTERDLLLTGHEDGSVRFWQTKHGDIQLLYRLDTAHLFGIELSNHSEINNESDEDWPPFKKVGAYNPFTDDPRLAVRQMIFCASHEPETLLLAGTAGQIIVCEFKAEEKRVPGKSSSKRGDVRGSVRESDEPLQSEVAQEPTNHSVVDVTVHQPFSATPVAHRLSGTASQLGEGLQDDEVSQTVTAPQSSDDVFSNGAGEAPGNTNASVSRGDAETHGQSSDQEPSTSKPICSPGSATSTKIPLQDGQTKPTTPQQVLGAPIETETIVSGNSSGAGNVDMRRTEASNDPRCRESYSSSLSSSSLQFEVKVSSVNLVGDRDDFVWMGHTPLEVVNSSDKNRSKGKASTSITTPSSVFISYPLANSMSCSAFGDSGPGFQASCIVLVHPPVSCTSLALQASWKLIAFGSEYGYCLYDYSLGKLVFSKSSKNADSRGTVGGLVFGAHSRLSDVFRRTLRASFRRLERARSEFRERRRRSQHTMWKSFSASRGTNNHPSSETRASLPNTSIPKESTFSSSQEYASIPDKPSSSSLNYAEPHKRNPYQSAGNSDLFKGSSLDRDPQTASLSRAGTPIVRCLYFAEDAFASTASAASTSNTDNANTSSDYPVFGTFWVGTSLGMIYMYNITISPLSKRSLQPVVYSLAKEIHLKHEAPILDICMLNKSGTPLHSGYPHYPLPVVNRNRRWKFPSTIFGPIMSSSSSSGQCLVVCSQKQVKVFSYPGLKAKRKVKVERAGSCSGNLIPCNVEDRAANASSSSAGNDTNTTDSQFVPPKNIAKVAYSCFENKTDESVVESGLVCLTDDGGASVYSVPSLKLRFSTSAVSKEFMNETKLCVLTSRGYGFYLCSPSEFGKFSMSSTCPKIHSLSLIPSHPMHCKNQKKKDSDGTIKNSSGEENSKRTPNSGSIVTSADPHVASLALEKITTVDQNITSFGETSELSQPLESRRSRSQSPATSHQKLSASGSRDGTFNDGSFISMTTTSSTTTTEAAASITTTAKEKFNKVTDISYIKDEETIEKIINKFVQMDVPDGPLEWRTEIQFSIPIQQRLLQQQQQQQTHHNMSPHSQSYLDLELFKPIMVNQRGSNSEDCTKNMATEAGEDAGGCSGKVEDVVFP